MSNELTRTPEQVLAQNPEKSIAWNGAFAARIASRLTGLPVIYTNDPLCTSPFGKFIGLPKNKLRREGNAGDPRACVAYKPQIARYEDLPEMESEDVQEGSS